MSSKRYLCKGTPTERCGETVAYTPKEVLGLVDRAANEGARRPEHETVYLTCKLGHVNPYTINSSGEIVDSPQAAGPAEPAASEAQANPPPAATPPFAPAAFGPEIDDAYWFNYSKTIVDGALKSRDDAADKLQTFVGWLWTVYTAGTAIGFSLGKLSLELGPALLVSSPVVALVIVYWMTVWVRVPVLRTFDPQIPSRIALVYAENVKEKQKRLKLTLVAAAGAALLVACALFFASTVPSASSAPSLQTVIHAERDPKQLFVTGNLGNTAKVAVTVYAATQNKERGEILASETTTADKGFFRSGPISLSRSAPAQVFIEATATLNSGGTSIVASKSLDIAACNTGVCK